jgi:hypothetical protein
MWHALGERKGVYRILVGRHEGKRPLAQPRHRWEDDIKMDLREIGINRLAQDRVQWQVLEVNHLVYVNANLVEVNTDTRENNAKISYRPKKKPV